MTSYTCSLVADVSTDCRPCARMDSARSLADLNPPGLAIAPIACKRRGVISSASMGRSFRLIATRSITSFCCWVGVKTSWLFLRSTQPKSDVRTERPEIGWANSWMTLDPSSGNIRCSSPLYSPRYFHSETIV